MWRTARLSADGGGSPHRPKFDRSRAIAALAAHGLTGDYDLQATTNLVPSCGSCNGQKGKRPPPQAPIIALLFERAARRAPDVDDRSRRLTSKRSIERALGVINASAASGALDDETRKRLQAAIETAAPEIQSTLALTTPVTISLHPALSLLLEPDRWQVVAKESEGVAFVTDGQRRGYTGTHTSFLCSRCGSHGPWDGIVCQSCGNREMPDW